MPIRAFEHFRARHAGELPPTPAAARREVGHFMRRLALLLIALTALTVAGGAALSAAEGYSLWRGIVQSVDIVATIGSYPHPQTVAGTIVELALITFGLGTLFYLLVTSVELFVAGHMSGLLEVWRMERQIDRLRDHFLICGFGRVGQQVARDFQAQGAEFVVIDENPEMREAMQALGVLCLHAAPSEDAVLLEAGIERARAVIACCDDDAENIVITLSARELAPDVEIIARAAHDSSEHKLLRAGADDVISPYKASGHAMAEIALSARRPVARGPRGLATPDQEQPARAASRRSG